MILCTSTASTPWITEMTIQRPVLNFHSFYWHTKTVIAPQLAYLKTEVLLQKPELA